MRLKRITTAALVAGALMALTPQCGDDWFASAAVNCGGQNAAPQPVPYTCNLPGIDITYQGVTRHFSAVVVANGVNVTVIFTMSAPLPVPVPVRIVHHEGISGAGGTADTAQGFIPAGSVTATLVDSAPCREGQLDVKAVYTANNQSQGRVGGPWIRNGTGCTAPTTVATTSPTTAPGPTVAPTTSPPSPSTPSTQAASTSSGPGASASAEVVGTIPATGSESSGFIFFGVLAFVSGSALFIVGRIRRRARS